MTAKENSQKPYVAIWMITYNHEKFVEKAVESIMEQETNFAYKLFLSEDFSKDHTREVCKKLKDQYPDKIELFLPEHNHGILGENSIGAITYRHCFSSGAKYIALCEGDDFWQDKFKLQKQSDFLDKNPEYVLSFHDAIIVDEDGKLLHESKMPESRRKDFSSDQLIAGAYLPNLSLCFRNVLTDLPKEFFKSPNGDTFLISILGNYGKAKYQGDIIPAAYRMHRGGMWSLEDRSKQLLLSHATRRQMYLYYKRIEPGKKSEINLSKYIKTKRKILSLHLRQKALRDFLNAYLDLFLCLLGKGRLVESIRITHYFFKNLIKGFILNRP